MSTHAGSYSQGRLDSFSYFPETGRYLVWDPTVGIETNSWSDTKPDRVRTRKPSGWLFPKAYSRFISHSRSPFGESHAILDGGHEERTWRGCFGGQVVSSITSDEIAAYYTDSLGRSNDRNACITKMLLKLKDQKVNLGVAFAERAATAELVGSSARRIAQAFTFARKGKFKRAASALGVSSRKQQPSNWLELQYGWKPLLSDIYGATELLRNRGKLGFLVTVKAATRNVVDVLTDPVNKNGPYQYRRHFRGEWGHFARCDYLPGSGFMRVLSYSGISNPLEIAWELVPYSFVVDWFLSVGNWLSALDAANGFEFKSGSITYRRVSSKEVTSDLSGIYYGSFKGSAYNKTVQREVLLSSPLPYAPYVKNPVSLGHMANGLSLLAEAFGRR